MQAIRLKPRSAVYWSCLAQCAYIQARYNSHKDHMLMTALEYMKVAVSLKPNDHLLWNALGVVAAHSGIVLVFIDEKITFFDAQISFIVQANTLDL